MIGGVIKIHNSEDDGRDKKMVTQSPTESPITSISNTATSSGYKSESSGESGIGEDSNEENQSLYPMDEELWRDEDYDADDEREIEAQCHHPARPNSLPLFFGPIPPQIVYPPIFPTHQPFVEPQNPRSFIPDLPPLLFDPFFQPCCSPKYLPS